MSKAPPLRLSLVTLGVEDLAAATAFYEKMGLQRRLKNAEGVSFFEAGSVVLSLYGRDALAKDIAIENSRPGFNGMTLAYNVPSEAEVDLVLDAAEKAGGKILKKGDRIFWGGYIGFFADLEGHIWEVAHNPGFTFDEHGNIVVPD
jgi:catechol 2,3-dioxygenase-like lactoylglutathione lyase family enzyme